LFSKAHTRSAAGVLPAIIDISWSRAAIQ